MRRDWKQIARGIAPEIPQNELEGVAAVLQALEEQFAPLRERLPYETEPALIFPCDAAGEELV
ncbi:MAG: hypothetical protein FJW26_17240 [Acidimicrobiia bacterium]|nr:hypothetical protein [Acidimicrobiia bacterium]